MNIIKYLTQFSYFLLVLTGFIFLNSSCNDPTLVGSELFDVDSIDINFTDTINILTKSVKGDSAIYSDRKTYFLGSDESDLFGSRTAALYLDTRRISTPPGKFEGAVIDSVVLNLFLDTSAIDIAKIGPQEISVFRVLDTFPNAGSSFVDLELNVDPEQLNEQGHLFTPLPKDSIKIKFYKSENDSSVFLRPQIRIPLVGSFVDSLTNPKYAESDSIFSTFLSGFKLESIQSNSLFALNFASANLLSVYYNIGDSSKHIYNYPVGLKRFNSFNHDYLIPGTTEPATLKKYINSASLSDSIIVVEGMAGADLEVDLSSIENYKDKQLNYAELVFFVNEDLQEDQTLVSNIVSLYEEDNGVLVFSLDVLNGIKRSQYEIIHDGYVNEDEGTGIRKYRIKITAQLNQFMRDNSLNKKLIFSVQNKSSHTRRTVLYGATHSKYPARLKAVFTEP